LALKFGVKVLPLIFAEYGLFGALFAFFAFMPLGHLTIGVLLVIIGLFCPKLPAHDKDQQIKVGAGQVHIEAKGSARTVLLGIGTLVIAGSFVEVAFRS
jgi:hypothetical protein